MTHPVQWTRQDTLLLHLHSISIPTTSSSFSPPEHFLAITPFNATGY